MHQYHDSAASGIQRAAWGPTWGQQKTLFQAAFRDCDIEGRNNSGSLQVICEDCNAIRGIQDARILLEQVFQESRNLSPDHPPYRKGPDTHPHTNEWEQKNAAVYAAMG